ncbi:MAG: endonuclease V [Deltaproteobacteria bacterium]|nr:endonuclease V [Deltaproteobacteria bacterium]
MSSWPTTADRLAETQRQLALASPEPWTPPPEPRVGGCFVCFARGGTGTGSAGDRGWAAAAVTEGPRVIAVAVVGGEAGAPYAPGLLALREGPLLEAAVRALPFPPDVLLVNATGRDHPRCAGLAVHLGAVLGLPTVGVTDRPLVAVREGVARFVTTRQRARPVVVHAAWRTDLATAVEIVTDTARGTRTPEPIRRARQAARSARQAVDSTRLRPADLAR